MIFVLLTVVFLLAGMPPASAAESLEERIRKLEEAIRQQQEVLKEQQKALDELKEKSKAAETAKPPEQQAPAQAGTAGPDYRLDDRSRCIYVGSSSALTPYSVTKSTTTPSLMNPAISLVLDTEYYHSSLSKAELQARGAPGYTSPLGADWDEGFNLRSLELGFFAPVDPYFNLYATVPIDDNGATLEEAYFVTTSLPAGFQVKGGKFKSGFGRFNAFHPHAWDFVDAPLPYKIFFGGNGEGLIEKGAQLTYLPALPLYTIIGLEILQGDNPTLFGPDGGPHTYTGFLKSSVDFADSHSILFGASVVGGKTDTGSFAPNTLIQGDSILYDPEFTYKWKPSKRRSIAFTSEYLFLHQYGNLTYTTTSFAESLKRNQDGLYLQALYQIDRWRIGARFDRMALFKDDVYLGGQKQTYSGQPYRATGSLEFNPTEYSRIRLQYN
ncbi:MAG TPA: hypothetical protein VLS90_11525, partial [Thermodesulfobacteriota bacterium]|nr:hypothetical protein [Thermodesulfobacteriota bacterium]